VIDIRLWTYAASTVPVSRLERSRPHPGRHPCHRLGIGQPAVDAALDSLQHSLAVAATLERRQMQPELDRVSRAGRRDGSASGPGDRSRVALPDMGDHRIAVMTNHLHGGEPEFVRPHC
jgi:hypothetical protein